MLCASTDFDIDQLSTNWRRICAGGVGHHTGVSLLYRVNAKFAAYGIAYGIGMRGRAV